MLPSMHHSNTQLHAPLMRQVHYTVTKFSHLWLLYILRLFIVSGLENKKMTMAMKKKGLRNGFILPLLFCITLFGSEIMVLEADDSTAKECGEDFQKVMICLDYAKGQASAPTKECCSAVKGIKDSEPKCLCYIIQQAHSGSETLKNMGVQEAKLLQLPSACQLQNASVANCPKLLGLAAGSPDAAIFSNASSSAAPTTPMPGTTGSPEKADDSTGSKHGPYLVGPTALITMAVFFYAVPTGSAFMF